MNFLQPPTSAIHFNDCPVCGNTFAACRLDLFRPDKPLMGSAWPEECWPCFMRDAAHLPHNHRAMAFQDIREHRALMHGLALQFSAAAG